jgi:hypothetical protein
MRWSTTTIAWGTMALMLALPAMAGATPLAVTAAPFFVNHGGATLYSSTTSSNWAGYAVTGAKGTVTDVKGSWTQPSVKCTGTRTQYAAFWVGIDGYNSNSVEQTGTDSDCAAGTPSLYAWYEFYPKPSHLIPALTIHVGDVISAQVSYSSSTSKFTATITDLTTAKTFTISAAVKAAARSSAEWIAEAPSSSTGVLPLANFGTVNFGMDNTSVNNTNDATVGSSTGDIGSFSTAVSINMIGVRSSSLTKAATSALSTDGTSFSVTWKAAGP